MDNDFCYWQELMVQTWTHGIDMEPLLKYLLMDSWQKHGIVVQTLTHGIDNTNGIDLDSQYRINTPESNTYKYCPYAGFLLAVLICMSASVDYMRDF